MTQTTTNRNPNNSINCRNNVIDQAEAMLASQPGSRLSGCTVDVTEFCGYYCDNPSDRVRLRFGGMMHPSDECLHMEVSDENDDVFYCARLTNPAIPDAICACVVKQIPKLFAIAIKTKTRTPDKPGDNADA